MRLDVTLLRLRYLKAVEDICMTEPFGLATPTRVEAVMGLDPRVAKVMMKRLFDMRWLGRPYRGCYHLSEKGMKILAEAEEG